MNTIEDALKDLKKGKMIIVVDDAHRENEGDFVMAAEKVTPDDINFMAQEGRGLICLSMQQKDVERLKIPRMTYENKAHLSTAFMVSIEAAKGVTTGSSTHDRAHTIRVASNPKSTINDIVMPGHVFPIAAVPGGVFVRRGHTEGSVDLMRLAGLQSSAVICEIMKKNGDMARLPDLKKIAKKYALKIISIEQLVAYRAEHDPVFALSATAALPTKHGNFTVKVFTSDHHPENHMALISPKKNKRKPLVRIHSECLTSDVFGSLRCDCGWQLEESLRKIGEEGGVLLYKRQEGRGIGLANKIKAYALQDTEYLDTVEANQKLGFQADARTYIAAAQILHQLKLTDIRLLTNNPDKIEKLELCGVNVIERIPLISEPNQYNQKYLKTKSQKLGHIL